MDDTCMRLAPAIVERGLDLGGEPLAHVASCPRCKKLALVSEEIVKLARPDAVRAPADAWDTIAAAAAKRRAHPAPEPSRRVSLACTFCHGPLAREQAVFCTGCLAPHHRECFAEYGKCATMGCGADGFVAPGRAPRRWPLLVALVATGALAGAALQATRHSEPRPQRDDAGRLSAERALRADLEQARAEVALAEAARERDLARSKSELEAAKIRGDAALKQLEIARTTLDRCEQSYRAGALAPSSIEEAKAKVAALEADAKLAQLAIDAAAAACDVKPVALELALKKLQRAESALATLESGLADAAGAASEIGAQRRHRSDLASSRDWLGRTRAAERELRERELEQVQSDLAAALAGAERDVARAKAELDVAKARSESAHERHEIAEKDVATQEHLKANGLANDTDLAAARFKEVDTAGDMKVADSTLARAQAALSVPSTDINVAMKKLERARAVLAAIDSSYAVRDAALGDEIARIDSTIADLERSR